jgi:hypothetical protein
VTPRNHQAVLAIVRLVGNQDTAATVQHPNTDEAVVAVRIGKALIYVHQELTAEHFLAVWEDSRQAAKALPLQADRDLVRTLRGMPEPGVVVNAIGRPACTAATVAEDQPGRRPFLRVQLGRVAFEVRDRVAFSHCLACFHEAHALARDVFLAPGSERVLRDAAAVARDAFFPTAASTAARRTPPSTPPVADRGRAAEPGVVARPRTLGAGR